MRVLYVNHTNTVSGAGISFSLLLRSLPEDVERFFLLHRKSQLAKLFGADSGKIFWDPFRSLNCTTLYGNGMSAHLEFFHALKAPLALPTIAFLRNRWGPDLIHLNETVLANDAVAASLLGIPLVIHARTVVDPNRFGTAMLAWVARRGRCHFISIDPETHNSLPPDCQLRSRVIYNPVEMSSPVPSDVVAKRVAWGLPGDAVAVGQVASLHKEKGIWRILEIARRLCPLDARLHFVLAGDRDPSQGEGVALANAIARAGLSDRVHLVGYEKDLPTAYGALDIVLCMFGEHLKAVGRTAYEAPLAGKCLIATLPNPDTSESIIQRKTAWGFDPDDLQGVCAAILHFSRNPGERKALGESARRAISSRHNPSHHAAQVVDVYHSLLETHRNPNK